jgi:hypothetical protein
MAISALTPLGNLMTPAVPMPIYLVLLTWFMSFVSILVIPSIYAATLPWLWNSKRFGAAVATLIVIVALLSALYLSDSWAYGLEYQGLRHTQIVALENALVFGVAFALACFGWSRKSQPAIASSYLLLFVGLAWCAFPYLGEVP